MEEAPAQAKATGGLARNQHVMALAAFSPQGLSALAGRIADYMEANPRVRVADVCHAANTRGTFNYRMAVVVDNNSGAMASQLRKFEISGDSTDSLFTAVATDIGGIRFH